MKKDATHILAMRGGPELIVSILLFKGALCPKCGYATRKTSKNWAKCKKCGERVSRRELPKQETTNE